MRYQHWLLASLSNHSEKGVPPPKKTRAIDIELRDLGHHKGCVLEALEERLKLEHHCLSLVRW